jgi:beta-mannanase
VLATAVIEYADPVLIRFAHEMNGVWYPWGTTNGNRAAEFPEAWRHVVDLFRDMGATNALWVWSPNILRGASSTTIAQFWPGPEYVDVVGMTGFGVRESHPEQTFGPTLAAIRQLTDKPILLAEIGAEAGTGKSQWVGAFGEWLSQHDDVIGFVWYQRRFNDIEDWRFDDTAENLALFKDSLRAAGVRC